MTLPPKELATVVKMLNLTMSNSDNETLTAIRKANAVLKKNGLGWEAVLEIDLFDNAKKSSGRESPVDLRAREINKAFELVLSCAIGELRTTILALEKQWRVKKTLSPGQYKTLMDAKKLY